MEYENILYKYKRHYGLYLHPSTPQKKKWLKKIGINPAPPTQKLDSTLSLEIEICLQTARNQISDAY